MNFLEHYNLKGKHAVFSPSSPSWTNYDMEKMINVYRNKEAAKKGTELHEFASNAIKLKRKQLGNDALSNFVNDSIDYKMSSEVILYFSNNFFGTADAISFNNNLLRIFDLKTGAIPGHMEQLMCYAALFCLEYKYDPSKIKIELRIYQYDGCQKYEPEVDEIAPIMDKIISFDTVIEDMKNQEDFINV